MAEKKKYKVSGKWMEKSDTGEWVETSAPLTREDAIKPVTPGKDFELPTAVKVQRFLRDAQLPLVPGAFPAGDLIKGVQSLLEGKSAPFMTNVPVGAGQTRATLTGIGGGAGATLAGGGALPSGPGALAAATAGYVGGQALGSGIGQGLENALPNLFQSGYAPENNPGQAPTSPSLDNVISDVALNTATDLATAGAGKLAKVSSKEGFRKAAAEYIARKYRPTATKPGLKPNLDAETVAAINANPDVPIDVGQVMGQQHVTNNMQELFRPQETTSFTGRQIDKLFEKANEFQTDVTKSSGFSGPARPDKYQVGKMAVDAAKTLEDNLTKAEVIAYSQVERLANPVNLVSPSTKVKQPYPLPPKIVPGATQKAVGPVKLITLTANAGQRIKELDKIIAEIGDPVLTDELKLARGLLRELGDGKIKDYASVREAEKALNNVLFNGKISPTLESALTEIRGHLVTDIEKNLGGKIKETAGGWKPGALEQYQKAKSVTQNKYDMFNRDMRSRLEAAGGDDLTRAGKRGGDFSKIYDTLLDSPQEAKRLADVTGKDLTKVAFVERFLSKHTSNTSKMIDGPKALEDLAGDNIGGTADLLLNRDEKQRLRHLLKLYSSVDAKISPVGKLAVEMSKANVAFQLPTNLVRGLTKAVGFIGINQFSEHFLLNDQFARQVVNLIGKKADRPGMQQEMARLMKTIQGAKISVRAANGNYLWDTKTDTLTKVPD